MLRVGWYSFDGISYFNLECICCADPLAEAERVRTDVSPTPARRALQKVVVTLQTVAAPGVPDAIATTMALFAGMEAPDPKLQPAKNEKKEDGEGEEEGPPKQKRKKNVAQKSKKQMREARAKEQKELAELEKEVLGAGGIEFR